MDDYCGFCGELIEDCECDGWENYYDEPDEEDIDDEE